LKRDRELHNMLNHRHPHRCFCWMAIFHSYSDPLRVKTIVSNLLSNSIKYSDPQKIRKYIQVSAHIFADKLFLTIEDNGIGIDAEHQRRSSICVLFVKRRQERYRPGTLHCKRYCRQAKGNIYVKSKKRGKHIFYDNFAEIPSIRSSQMMPAPAHCITRIHRSRTAHMILPRDEVVGITRFCVIPKIGKGCESDRGRHEGSEAQYHRFAGADLIIGNKEENTKDRM